MKKFLFGGAAAALAIAIAPAVAQPAPPPGVAQGTMPVVPVPQLATQMHMRVLSDRVMTREEVVQHVRKLFARLDANHDGFVTKEELGAFHQQMMGTRRDIERGFEEHRIMTGDRAAMFDRLDTNHDGVISRQEFMAAQPQLREHRTVILRNGPEGAPGAPGMRMHDTGMGMVAHLFEMADSNRDGRVSLQEAEAAALAHFDRVDLNHDGKITPEERQQAHQLRHGEHHPS